MRSWLKLPERAAFATSIISVGNSGARLACPRRHGGEANWAEAAATDARVPTSALARSRNRASTLIPWPKEGGRQRQGPPARTHRKRLGAPNGNRTRVSAVKGRRPGPLDDGRNGMDKRPPGGSGAPGCYTGAGVRVQGVQSVFPPTDAATRLATTTPNGR